MANQWPINLRHLKYSRALGHVRLQLLRLLTAVVSRSVAAAATRAGTGAFSVQLALRLRLQLVVCTPACSHIQSEVT